jgi:hypothetical protein
LRSTNNLERVNKEIARRSDVVGIFTSDDSVIGLVRALLIEQNDCVSGWGCRPHGRRSSPESGGLTRGYLSKELIGLVLEDQGDGDGSEVAAPEG